MAEAEKRIETVELAVGEINDRFGNPRKITAKKKKELEESLDTLGDFGLILIDENNSVIAGNQRIAILKSRDPNTKVLCKRLIGYTEAELRAINIKDNTHNGEWDLDALADWTADLNVDLGIKPEKNPEERKIKDMELIRYEKYDYVLLVCRNELDYNELIRKLGIEGAKVKIAGTKRSIKARAIWYDQIKCQLTEGENE